MATAGRYVGKPVPRVEDVRLVRGLGRYVDDLALPGMLYLGFVRSPHAHARIRGIETARARTAPGVVAVVTADDLGSAIGPVPCAAQIPDMRPAPRPVLAGERVRFVGEAVAAVVATDRYALRDALELVEVDYEPLPAVVELAKALRRGAPRVHEQHPDNIAYRWQLEGGDLKEAFRRAERVIRHRMTNQRLIPMAMEPRAVLADYQPGEDRLTVWSSTQIPHLLRTQLAAMLRLPETRLRVVAPEVGGGFGSKLNVYPEEALAAYLARQLCRPVKWTETRRENFLATIHGRDQVCEMEFAIGRDGTVLGLRARLWADLGAYYQLLTPLIPTLTGLMIAGCYRIPAVRVDLMGVFTHKMATDAYRGAGRPEATYFIERAMDYVAAELGEDPAEFRRRHFPRPEEFPYATATGLVYDTGNYAAAFELALKKVGYARLRQQQRQARRQGRLLGIGISSYVEICALGPSSAMPAGGWESATVRIEPSGKVRVLTGSSPHGQGEETSFAQIVADQFGIPLEDVSVVHGDTDQIPYGIGTFGSRTLAVGGTAIYRCCERLREKLARIAAQMVGEADPGRMVFRDGKIYAARDRRRAVAFTAAVAEAYVARKLPPGLEPGLEATHFYEPSNFTFPFGTHVAVVEVDPETGRVELLRYVAVDDCGRVINPLLVEGQVVGGIVQSLGQVFLEEAVYDEQGQLLTGELTDYALPRAADVPRIETYRTETPTPVNPLGAKGVGEAGTIGATPALVNAVVDALAPLGVRHLDMPLKPERIWRAVAGARAAAARRGGRR